MRIRAARDHVLHANSTLVDRVDLATAAIVVLSTGLSALAPAQRAGAQRLRALAHIDEIQRSAKRRLLGVTGSVARAAKSTLMTHTDRSSGCGPSVPKITIWRRTKRLY